MANWHGERQATALDSGPATFPSESRRSMSGHEQAPGKVAEKSKGCIVRLRHCTAPGLGFSAGLTPSTLTDTVAA